MTGRWTRLRPIEPTDVRALYQAEVGTRWRLQGRTPSPVEYEQLVYRNILAQFVVCGTGNPRPLGLVATFRNDTSNGHCHFLAFKLDDAASTSIRIIEGTQLLIDYVFRTWPVRKIYFETDDALVAQFPSALGRDVFQLEGRFENHYYVDGGYVDQLTFAIHRSAWEARSAGLVAVEPEPALR